MVILSIVMVRVSGCVWTSQPEPTLIRTMTAAAKAPVWTAWGKAVEARCAPVGLRPPSAQRPALASYTTPWDANENPHAMRQRRETVEHPFGTMKARMGATHFLMKTLPKVAGEMALSVLAYNPTRVLNIVGIKPLMAAIWA